MQTILSTENNDFKNKLDVFLREYFTADLDLKSFWKELFNKGYISNNNSLLQNILLTETVCKYDPGIGLFLLTHFSNIELIKAFGSESVKKKYLDDFISGEKISCFSLTEENAGSDISQIETLANLEKDKWLLNGKKIWASNASLADLIILFAQVKSKGDKSGITVFLIDQPCSGLTVGDPLEKFGIKTTPSCPLALNNVSISSDSMLGNVGDGFKIALSTITYGRLFCSAQAIGLLDGILSETIKNVSKRNQFGHSISDYQAIQWYIADMAKDLDGAKLLLYKAVWAKENNMPDSVMLSSMTKSFSTKSAQKHSTTAVQMAGSRGILEDSFLSRAYRDSKVLEIYEGTNEIQNSIIAREIFA